MTPCLTNCSNNGICLLNSTLDKYSCNCSNNFNGESCQFDLRPCSKYPCLNNGTCINKNVNTNEFECKCLTNYYGIYCENKKDLCLNETCSNNGYCFVNDSNLPFCNCFNGYDGHKCDLEGSSVKVLKNVRIISILICAFIFVFVIFLIISNDIWNYCMIKKQTKTFTEKKIYRFVYKVK